MSDVKARIRRAKSADAAHRKPPKGKAYIAAKERRREASLEPLSDAQVQVRMTATLHDKLRFRAYEERRSVGAVIRNLCEDGLKRRADA